MNINEFIVFVNDKCTQVIEEMAESDWSYSEENARAGQLVDKEAMLCGAEMLASVIIDMLCEMLLDSECGMDSPGILN